jgi:hypothetical protein
MYTWFLKYGMCCGNMVMQKASITSIITISIKEKRTAKKREETMNANSDNHPADGASNVEDNSTESPSVVVEEDREPLDLDMDDKGANKFGFVNKDDDDDGTQAAEVGTQAAEVGRVVDAAQMGRVDYGKLCRHTR